MGRSTELTTKKDIEALKELKEDVISKIDKIIGILEFIKENEKENK